MLGVVLVIAAACGGAPTAPATNTMSPNVEPLFDEGDCRGGFSTANGKAC
jgi:hypothetical protein